MQCCITSVSKKEDIGLVIHFRLIFHDIVCDSYTTHFQAVVAVVVSNVVGEAQLPIAHEQARQKFEFHKNTHRNQKELRFDLYSTVRIAKSGDSERRK